MLKWANREEECEAEEKRQEAEGELGKHHKRQTALTT